jgi:hypothetical protein
MRRTALQDTARGVRASASLLAGAVACSLGFARVFVRAAAFNVRVLSSFAES